MCEREMYECVCVFCLPSWAAASQGQGPNPSHPLLTAPHKVQRESIDVCEMISLHCLRSVLGKPCLDQTTGLLSPHPWDVTFLWEHRVPLSGTELV